MMTRLMISLWLVITAPACSAQVAVHVWQENLADGHVFHYRVVNNSRNSVVGISVGFNAEMNENQLTVDPKGIDYEAEPSDTLVGIAIPPAGATTPPGWQAALVLTEEDSKAHLYYQVVEPSAALSKNLMMRGFQVVTPTLDAAYRTGSFAVLLDNGAWLPGRLEPDAVDAPVPTATVSGGGTICGSEAATVTALLSGHGPWSLQWSDGITTSHATPNASRSVAPFATGRYSVISIDDVNREGTASGNAPVTVGAPQIVTQPQSVTIPSRSSTTLTVTVFPTDATYQWYQGAVGQTSKRVGTNAAAFTTPSLRNTTSYWVRITNHCGYTNSQSAVVTVQ